MTGDPSTFATVDVDVRGGSRLFLAARPLDATAEWNRVLWRDPRLILADGSERALTELVWAHADACWDSTAVKRDDSGTVLGIGAEIPAVVEYELPAGVVRFRASAEVLSNGRGRPPGPAQFLAVVAQDAVTPDDRGLNIPVSLGELGLGSGARIRDLWTHRDLGEFRDEFAPEVLFHGAGLYRLSPLPADGKR